MGVAALSTYNTRSMLAQGNGATKLNCDNRPCDDVARGRAAFNDRNLKQLGGNGRACADCHVPSDSFQLSPAVARARFEALLAKLAHNKNADDPLFRPVDADDFRVNGDNASDFSNLVENGLVRVTMPLPLNVKVIDPATGQTSNETSVDLWRAVMPVLNVAIPDRIRFRSGLRAHPCPHPRPGPQRPEQAGRLPARCALRHPTGTGSRRALRARTSDGGTVGAPAG